ncbi:regulating synaptic membrane exocytosis protein 1-like isoform X2 [Neocloeon triangulifer]|uniref:regulating synaptic membrane exocytosis protein 1-like isoform X2 n=1 Tax=Neocloeon triangulifer TaxID=2078957 RepID=UPI00286F28B3|nr:regulating synaptic membrane exocytosis protein 1-like isoform X2 [Neocloeon triangulifer]
MLPTNVMYFMKKMVTTTETESSGSATGGDTTGTTLSKLRQTLSSGLMSAQETVTKLSPTRQSMTPDAAAVAALAMAAPNLNSSISQLELLKTEQTKNQQNKLEQLGRPRSGACRVCLKSFKTEDFFRICCECTQKVCEDCASYSKNEEGLEDNKWRCSICRRRTQGRGQTQRTASASGALGLQSENSAGDLLELPGGLQRRHSDVKIGAGQKTEANNTKVLDIPRSPELRRHSDVSPASLRELEKVAGEHREELRWEREMEWRAEQQQGRLVQRRGGAKFIVGDDPKSSESSIDDDTMTEEEAEWRRQQSQRGGKGGGFGGQSPRRRSRAMQRQRSYDDEDQTLSAQPQYELSRRASAYDVYQTAGMAKMVEAGDSGGGRRPSFRVSSTNGTTESGKSGFDSSPSDNRRFQQDEMSGGGLGVEDDGRRGRRRSSAIEGMRALPATPAAGERRVSAVPSRIMGGPEVDSAGEPIRRQASVTAGEDIKIVIHDVDSEAAMSRPGTKRRVMLRRDPSDKAHRTRGFGFRVVGGKSGSDGRLFAYIVWTVPQGPADQAGLVQGDRVLEWNGVSLIDKSFEEVCAVMDRTGDAADIVIEHFPDMRMTDLLDDISMAAAAAAGPRKSASDVMGLQLDNEQDKGPTSPTRRKLPKTPEQLAREKTVSGRVQIHVWYVEEKRELVVSVLAADDLAPRDDTGYGSQPEAYVRLQVTNLKEPKTLKTDVAEPTHNPIWNATFEIPNVPAESLMKMNIDISMWDYCPDRDSQFLGECTVELQKAFLEDRPNWYRLEDQRQLRFKSPHVSPRGSLANPGTAAREIAQRLLRRGDFTQQRSYSDDKDDETAGNVSHSSSVESGLLHPDHAYVGGSRRGSSQSETLEVDTYQLGRDFSRSLPGSRRSSFQNSETQKEELGVGYSRERRRSSSSRGGAVMGHYEQREELMIGTKAGVESSGAGLSRTLSLSQDKKPARRPSRYAHDILTGAAAVLSRLDHPERRKSYRRKSSVGGPKNFEGNAEGDTLILGPGQIRPRGFMIAQLAGNLPAGGYGEIKIALLMTKGQLELEIVCAKGLNAISRGDSAPDTYVKSYLKDGDRWLQKRKTRVCRSSYDPVYNQKLRYNACDVLGRVLIIMLWERQKGFESNQGLGGAEIALDKLQLTNATNAWYPIFPMNSLNGLDEPLIDSP